MTYYNSANRFCWEYMYNCNIMYFAQSIWKTISILELVFDLSLIIVCAYIILHEEYC